MSYLALARKYRPQTFEELVGQDHISRTLQNAIAQDKVHHAFLFTGTRGVGKTTAARILAKALNCEKGPAPAPCNVCKSCEEITAGKSVDVLEIDGASNRGIDDVRELRESVRYMPSGARYRLVIIDEVHMLTREAFNALLKTLEEPPAHVKFILATTDPHRLPDTILSRVQRYDFREIAAKPMHAYLAMLTKKEDQNFPEDNLTLIVRKARGSMRDALSLLDQSISFGGADITTAQLADLLGITDWRHLFHLSEAVLEGDAHGTLERFEEVFRYAYDNRQFYLDLLEHFRNLVVSRVARDPGKLMDATSEEAAELSRLAQKHEPEHLQLLFRMLVKAEDEILRSTNPKLVLEMAVLAMATVRPVVGIDKLLDRLSEVQAVPVPVGVPVAAPVPGAAASNTPAASYSAPATAQAQATASPVSGSLLEQFRQIASSISPKLVGLLTEEHAEVTGATETEVTIQAKSRFFYDNITEHGGFDLLQKAARQWKSGGAKLVVLPPDPERIAESAAQPAGQASRGPDPEKVREVRKQALENPIVQEALDLFDGEIQDVKVEES